MDPFTSEPAGYPQRQGESWVAGATARAATGHRSETDITVVIPAFNEAKRLGRGLPRLLNHVDPNTTEIVIVDDGSADSTSKIASELLVEFPHGVVLQLPGNLGKGAAVRAGVMHARGAVTVFMDADMAADPRDLQLLLEGLERADVAIGSRAAPGAVVENVPRMRMHMGRMFNRFIRPVTGLSILDTQCGFKAFRTSSAKLLFALSNVDGFAFDVEILLLAHRIGLPVREVAVRWSHQPCSHVSPLQDSVTMISDVVRIRRAGWSKAIPAVAVEPLWEQSRTGPAMWALACNVRSTDAVFGIGRGALALLPFAPPKGVASVTDRLRRRLHDFVVCPTVVKLEDLIDLAPTQRHAHDRVVTGRPVAGIADAVEWSGLRT